MKISRFYALPADTQYNWSCVTGGPVDRRRLVCYHIFVLRVPAIVIPSFNQCTVNLSHCFGFINDLEVNGNDLA